MFLSALTGCGWGHGLHFNLSCPSMGPLRPAEVLTHCLFHGTSNSLLGMTGHLEPRSHHPVLYLCVFLGWGDLSP